MNRFAVTASALAILLTANVAGAQTDCPPGLPPNTTCFSGRDSNGAYYLMAKPALYNGVLVLWNHGYSTTPPRPVTAADLGPAGALLQEGFAAAASSFRPDNPVVGQSGWQVSDGAEDSENLRQLFVSTFGRPALTLVVGVSMGGLVTAEQIEKFAVNPDDGSLNYNGAMPMCGPLAGGLVNWWGAYDLRVVYQYYCQNLPRPTEHQYPLWYGLDLFQMMSIEEIAGRVNECTGILQPPGTRTPRQLQNLADILGVTKIPASFLVTDMIFATLAMEELVQIRLLLRNPVTNIGVVYSGSITGDDALNAGVFRDNGSNPIGVAGLRAMYDPTGDVPIPTLTMHTIGDGLVIVENERAYQETRQAAGTAGNLFQVFTNKDGPDAHCGFSNSEFAAGFHALLGWVVFHQRPSQGEVGALCHLFRDVQFHDTCMFNPTFQPGEITDRILPREP